VSIVVLTVITVAAGIAVRTVGDKGRLPSSLPVPGLPDVPLDMHTLTVIAPYALAMALVGLMETMMTAKLADESPDTRLDETREAVGQGIAGIAAGVFGGMGGCAMIGQTMIDGKNGARTRLSTFLAGFLPARAVHRPGPGRLPDPHGRARGRDGPGRVGTFDWHSVKPATLTRMPVGETAVVAVTVIVVVATGNLSIGVVVGTINGMIVFARRVAHLTEVTAVTDPDGSTVTRTAPGRGDRGRGSAGGRAPTDR